MSEEGRERIDWKSDMGRDYNIGGICSDEFFETISCPDKSCPEYGDQGGRK